MGLVDTVRDVVSLVQKTDNMELINKVLELQNQLLELVQARWDMQKDVERLRRRISELEDEKRLREELEFAHNSYWRGGAAQAGDGPYCPRCWDQLGRLARMLHNGDNYTRCPECNTVIELPWHAHLKPEYAVIRARP